MSRAWMPLYAADYLADTGHLSTVEHGAYMLLIMHYWTNAGLPTDERRLARICRMTPEEWAEHRDTLADLFEADWQHKRIDRELRRSAEVVEKARLKAQKRWAKPQNGAAQDATAHATALPGHMPEACQSQSQSQKEGESANALSARAGEANALASDFEDWYAGYPHKVGRAGAAKSYFRVRKGGAVHATLCEGRDRYIRLKPPDRAWCNPATWLNQERWKDEPAPLHLVENPYVRKNNGKSALLEAAWEQYEVLTGVRRSEDTDAPRLLSAGGSG